MTAQPGTVGVVEPRTECPNCGSPSSDFSVWWFTCGTKQRPQGGLQIDEGCWQLRCKRLEVALAQANADRQALLTAGCIALIPAAMHIQAKDQANAGRR